jgi:hypothetical protein
VSAALARPARRWRRVAVATAAVVLASIAGGAAWLRPAVCFLARGTDTPLRFCPETAIRRTEKAVPEAGLTVDVYDPPRPATATLVLVPGLHPEGIHDPRFRSFASACAQAGFQVVAPDLVEFRTFHIEAQVVDRLARLVEALPRHLPAGTLGNLGLFGVSYAGGPVLVAAARPEIAARLQFVGAFGGYYDLVHAVDYALTGTHAGAAGLSPPHEWARMILVWQDAGAFLPEPDASAVSEALRLRLSLNVEEAQRREAQLSPAARAFLRAVLEGPSPQEAPRFRAALPRYQPLSRRLSPSAVVPVLDRRLRVYLLHGRSDDVIPYVETEEMVRAFEQAGHPRVRALISTAFRHVDPSGGGGGPAVWAARLRLLVWTRAFVGEASR